MRIPGFWSRVAFAVGVIVVSAAWLMRPLDRSVLIPVTFRSSRFVVEQGYINLQGREVFDQRWASVEEFNGDSAYVGVGQSLLGQWLDRKGRIVASPDRSNGSSDSISASLKRAAIIRGIRGYADSSGQLKYPLAWDRLPPEIPLVPVRQGQLWGYMNRSNEWVVPPRYSEAATFQLNGTAVVVRDEKFGCIDGQGNEVIAPRWGTLSDFDPDHRAIACMDGRCGVIDHRGQIEIPIAWDSISRYSYSDLWSVSDQGRWGVVNQSGDLIVPCQYDVVSLGRDGEIEFFKATLRNQSDFRPNWLNQIWLWCDSNLGTNLMFHEEQAVYDTNGHLIWRSSWWFKSWAWISLLIASAWILVDVICCLWRKRS